MAETVLLEEMTREEVRRLAPEATAVLPTASIEQHGPHLPLLMDSVATTAICQRAATLARSRIPIAVAPTLVYGYSEVHFPHAALSLSTSTFIQVLKDLGESLYRCGFRRIAIINGHGPNDQLIRVAAWDLTEAFPVSVTAATYWTLGWETLVRDAGAGELDQLPGHAGAFESSLVWALRPELVDTSAIPPRQPGRVDLPPQQLLKPLTRLLGSRHGEGPGYTDDPSIATPEMGERFLGAIVKSVADFLVDFHGQHPRG